MVRGITDVKTINNQDFDTNNVNDLLSDGQYNYIHRKKGKTEEYHNLTDNIKTISSDNTELLTVTNNNKTTNTATLHPKHDSQKEQLLESQNNTINISHGTNGTNEKTKVDTNPEKVLEHSNLLTDYGISKTTAGNTTKIGLEYTKVENGFDLNNLLTGNIRGEKLVNAPNDDILWFFVSSVALAGGSYAMQEAIKVLGSSSTKYKRTKNAGVWGEWREQVGDKSVIDDLLAQKQDVLTAGDGITINGQTISYSGTSSSIEYISLTGNSHVFKYVVRDSRDTFVTYTFNVDSATAQYTFVGDLKNDLEKYVGVNKTFSNGALKLTNDGTSIKLINNNISTESENLQGTFTFYERTGGGGGGSTS